MSRTTGCGALLALLMSMGACDFNVTNPGPAQDGFLDDPESWGAVVAGVNRAYNEAWNDLGIITATMVREYFPSGNTGYKGMTALERQGLTSTQDRSGHWNDAQNARWLAENAVQRFQDAMPAAEFAKSPLVATSYLFAGYSNRLLGENFCESVINGGPLVPRTVNFQRADSQFTKAMEVGAAMGASGTSIATAAKAARASVRASLGSWDAAVTDAKAIADNFRYQTPYSGNEQEANNGIYIGTLWLTAATVWNTFYYDYYTNTKDPRTPWGENPAFPVGIAGIGPYGRVPFKPPRKYPKAESPVTLSSGREMRLLEAEALLIKGDWQGAMQLINKVRTSTAGVTLTPWSASSLAEAWTMLARERGIELWIEARRFWDRDRWKRDNRPITYDVHELPSTTQPKHERGAGTYLSPNHVTCYPVPDSERETNPNVPLATG